MSITLPSYVSDVAKVQIYCSWAEALLGVMCPLTVWEDALRGGVRADSFVGRWVRYFLYYEDVDLCRRLRARGYEVRLVPSVSAVHYARRQSRRSLFHLRRHLASMLRFFLLR